MNLPADIIATSDDWGTSKPDQEFFEKLIQASGHNRDEIVYVGDRLDNDIAPAAKAGLQTILVRRGPWGYILESGSAPMSPTYTVASLLDIPNILQTEAN